MKYKQVIVKESLEHLGGYDNLDIEPVLTSEKQFAYRNKMEFSFSDRRWLLPNELNNENISKDFALGLHVPGTFDKILQIDECLLQSDIANNVLALVKDYVVANKLEPYGIRTHNGFLRFLVIRESSFNGNIMVNIVTAYENTMVLKPLAQKLIKQFAEIKCVVNNVNSKLAQIAIGEKEYILAGEAVIKEKLGKYIFNISANSFFQTNTFQAERLYQKVIEFADLSGKEIIWDLYCGTGTIAIFLAEYAKKIIGFELVENAINDAEKNAEEHGIKNTTFIGGDLLNKLKEMDHTPDVLVTDPPRSGMHPKVVAYINNLKPARIIYVSCNPTTLARDLSVLKENYEIKIIQPVDMFPQTYHIETVVKLNLR
jgi:23S rRNA (uracil1939-C5)-methyltransferase